MKFLVIETISRHKGAFQFYNTWNYEVRTK